RWGRSRDGAADPPLAERAARGPVRSPLPRCSPPARGARGSDRRVRLAVGRLDREGARRRARLPRCGDRLVVVPAAPAPAASGGRGARAVSSSADLVERLCGDLTRVRAPRGPSLHARSWQTEAPLRMLLNNLDPEVAEHPESLVVYGGTGRAARSHAALKAIVRTLLRLGEDETLLVQSGKPVGVFRTHADAPRVLIANSLLVPAWATWDEFRRLEALGLTMFGQMTAGSWIYIGTQGILQGTYQTFATAGETHFGSPDLAGRTILTAGLGGMGGA